MQIAIILGLLYIILTSTLLANIAKLNKEI
jgi:hypothetical protein